EMTVKAGQKCTSVRRAIVPEGLKSAVIDAIGARLGERVVIGDPRAEGVTMGALASLEQLDSVRAAVETVVAAGGRLAIGSLDAPAVRRADGSVGAAEHGAFMSPVLLDWADPEAPTAHTLEA